MGMGIDDSLNGLICVHLWSISLRLFKDLLSAIAMMVFSDKHKSQNLEPLEYGLAFNRIFHFTIGLRPFFFTFHTYFASSDLSSFSAICSSIETLTSSSFGSFGFLVRILVGSLKEVLWA